MKRLFSTLIVVTALLAVGDRIGERAIAQPPLPELPPQLPIDHDITTPPDDENGPPIGLISRPSPYSVEETVDRLEQVLSENDLTVIARVDHEAGAASVDLELRPTQVLIFGNPLAGTPLMQCGQTIAIDLPQKALVWQDETGQVWLGYNNPYYLAERHRLSECDDAVEQVANALENLMSAAVEPEAVQPQE
jgi:uncharacterized protein (DUF302 family)